MYCQRLRVWQRGESFKTAVAFTSLVSLLASGILLASETCLQFRFVNMPLSFVDLIGNWNKLLILIFIVGFGFVRFYYWTKYVFSFQSGHKDKEKYSWVFSDPHHSVTVAKLVNPFWFQSQFEFNIKKSRKLYSVIRQICELLLFLTASLLLSLINLW